MYTLLNVEHYRKIDTRATNFPDLNLSLHMLTNTFIRGFILGSEA